MSPLAIVYIVTIIMSILVASFLIYFAEASVRARMAEDKKRKKQEKQMNTEILTDQSLKEVIYEQLQGVVYSRQRHEEIAEAVSSIFSNELNKRVELNTKKLTEEYGKIIQEKSQKEEVAWKKYNRVLSDKKQTEAVIRSIAEGLVVVDPQGKVIMMNPAAEKLLGISKKDKLGKPLLENLKTEQLVSLAKTSQEEEDREIELVSQEDETKKILRASSAVIENEDGQTIGMVSVLNDVTKQKELDRLKATFIANVSHELHTPLVAIDKSISLILDKTTGQISESQQELLSIAARNLKRLSVIINDLLDLSKLEAAKMELKCQPCSIEEVIDESVEGLYAWAKTKSITLKKNIQEALPKVNIDPTRIIQVLNNLIGNSIKFTPQNGTITVEASLQKEKGWIEISVQDTGIGIKKEALTRVFDKFYQAGERTATDIHGTGIGLSIAKEIVELHGGRIWVESKEAEGAKFTFTLSLKSEDM